MASLIKSLMNYKAVIEKGYENFKKSPKERLARESYLQTRLDTLEEQWVVVSESHRKLTAEATDALFETKYFKDDIFENIEETYIWYKSDLKELISDLKATVPNTSQIKNQFNVKLPKISIPSFSGNYSEWITFRDLYVSLVHNNDAIDNVQKMHYLKGHLSGEAEQLLRHIPISAVTYHESWAVLNNRYNNKKYLANCLLRRFMNQPSISIESCSAIKELHDAMNETLNGLKHLGINVDTWDIIIIYIICSKFDTQSRKQWEAKISISDDLPTMAQLREFMEARFKSLEFLNQPKQRLNVSIHKPKAMHATTNSSYIANKLCSFCKNGEHKLYYCKAFCQIDCNTRRNFVQTRGLCFNCLGNNHSANTCRCPIKCRICKHKHHSLLHPEQASETTISGESKPELLVNSLSKEKPISKEPASSSSVAAYFSKAISQNQILLATALVKTYSSNGHTQLLRALLDQGSQASFVTESAVQLLGLKRTLVSSVVSGLGGDRSTLTSKYVVVITIQSRLDPNFQVEVRAHVISNITGVLPSERFESQFINWPELKQISLADPNFNSPSKIDILLGADVYSDIIREGLIKCPNGGPSAQSTALGWIISGPVKGTNVDRKIPPNCYHNVITNLHNHIDDNELLRRFWQIESDCFETKLLSQEEQLCEEFYHKTTQRDSSGRYIVRLPFREEDPQCKYGNSKNIAFKRLKSLEHRFKRFPDFKSKYSQVIHEYLELGHMERIINKDEHDIESVYLPHHAVIREDKTTSKLRVVFDASCKGINGISLNDTLMIGPTLQQDLRHIIMRWRMYPICLSADIVKMYRQIIVDKRDADFQRILWKENPESETEVYRLVRVTFGTASAPYLAVKTLQQLAMDESKEFLEVAEKVKTDFYVDDLLTGCETVEDGIKIYKEMTELLSRGGFELQKWLTNDTELAKVITNTNKEENGIHIKIDDVVKILGIFWNKSSDSFHYSVQLPKLEGNVTKRKVISDISRLFDPLGWVAPCVILAKIMIQKLWLAGIDWDDELPDELLHEWVTYRSDLIQVCNVSVPRWIKVKYNDKCRELHGFCDASTAAYAAAIYLRIVDSEGNVHVHLVAAKTKVAPTMQVSIPRLELMGAVLLAKLCTEVANCLGIKKCDVHCWTDSTVVLAWLSSHPSRWTTFIGNRTSEILSKVESSRWSHVESAQNPADVASRGCLPNDLSKNNMWFYGPEWLGNLLLEYKRPKTISTELEKRKIKTHIAINNVENKPIWNNFSSLRRLVRVVAFCRRFLKIKEVNQRQYKFEPYLTSNEIHDALEALIKQCQSLELIDYKKRLKLLTPFYDSKGILRAQGRLQNSMLPENVKHPIILPHKSKLTDLIVDDAHKRTLHGGPTLMLNHLRTRYWIVSGKSVVKHFVRKCVTCTRHAAISKPPFMGALPSVRVTPSRPFLHTGVDFAGPINIRFSKGRGNHSYKGYICVFVCMVTKAIHLEPVSDLSSSGFIASFKRLVARRGYVSDIWSDNGTNFVGAYKELKHLIDAEKSSVALEIREWLNNNNVTWHFIPPHAPNFGGLWEAGVKSTKFHLKRVINNSTLTYEEMATVLAQIEACLNSRPLSVLPNSADESSPLTPGHFLVGEPLVIVPERNYEQSNITSLRRWQITQRMVQDFWRKWSSEYLVHCLQRYKWSKFTPEPNIGNVVLVKEDNLPPARWLLGIIIEKHPGLDGVTRVVTLRCNKALIKRPISKVCVLPVTD